jgi:hypothetical protein
VLSSDGGDEAGVAEWACALLMLPVGDAHQPHTIAEVVLHKEIDFDH